jgi:hypothetical protein
MRRSHRKNPQPPHGRIQVSSMKLSHAKNHLRIISESAAVVKDYNGHEAIGCHSEGELATNAASGATYQTTSANDNPDPDWSGTSR